MSEFKAPCEYESLNALLQELCTFQENLKKVLSVQVMVKFRVWKYFLANEEHFAFSIKGHTYSIEELLKDSFEKDELKMGLIMSISIFLQKIIIVITALVICNFKRNLHKRRPL